MSLYLDASVITKLLRNEPETIRVGEILGAEFDLVVSELGRLEALVVIDSWMAGGLSESQSAERRTALEKFLLTPGLQIIPCRSIIFQIAETQLPSAYCPTLDRLHLAVMEDLGLRRLFTNDGQQAGAARALGFEVIMPR